NGLAGYPLVGTLIYLGQPVSAELVEKVRHLFNLPQLPNPKLEFETQRGQFGITRTQGEGLLCRYRGHSTAEVKDKFTEIWQLLRLSMGEPSECPPRVWQR
ncbi:MAG: urease accessory protein UreD, partial [Cyanobacteriota bacterium]|nr:urease accessory protein UreD [Cyanobacteriota bacterium]